ATSLRCSRRPCRENRRDARRSSRASTNATPVGEAPSNPDFAINTKGIRGRQNPWPGNVTLSNYERKRWPIEPPDAIDAIRYRMERGGFTQADLGRLLGSRQRASDVLKGKRPLTMSMAWRLHREWGIPAEALIAPP